MGDMKTPDFDDLLAAFDIPDATGLDAKEPIQESPEETESQLKHPGICLGDSLLNDQALTTSDVPVVSVIVKNTSRQESLEGFGDRLHSGPALQNGFRAQGTSIDMVETNNTGFSESLVSALNGETSGELLGDAPIEHKSDGTFTHSLSQLSPVSSPETEVAQSNRDEICPTLEQHNFPGPSVLTDASSPDNLKKFDISAFDECTKDSPKNTNSSRADSSKNEELSDLCNKEIDKTPRLHNALLQPNDNHNLTETDCKSGTTENIPASYVKSQTKLSSCLEALVALNARKDPSEQTNPRESAVAQSDCLKASPKVPISPRSPRSPLEAVKRLMKPSDSPMSICSDSSGKASPAVASASPPAIPRVRIKTIKTTSGQIKRTVTSVLPDSETDEVHSAYESSPSQSMISEDSYNMSPHQSVTADSIVGLQIKGIPVCTSSPKVLLNKLDINSRKTGISQSATVSQNTAGSVKRSITHKRQKPKRPSASVGNTTSSNFLPKAMHLASLNLVPHSVAASVAARSTSHQQSQHTLSSLVYNTVPLVHQVKTANPYPRASVNSTAAGTLNRLLNNANPVPTYVPDLNPPPESNISLPPRGYCCLECGDSFGVEKSLEYHYSRRSVHIEVSCTHCGKTMVFFNKCALLAHAREHKNNGTVMQCTQLHMKPIAEEQMFVPLSTEPVNVESCPSTSPSHKRQPAMPLYPDSVVRQRPCCVECNKQLPDFKALAGHYQRLSEDTDGLMCKVCSMWLPNKCSFRAHQRIHTHKSPYCCPECGALSRSADIQKHVKENCLHYARKAWYKCLHCDMVFKSLQGQKTHIEEKHCETFFKCSVCPLAFKSTDSCEVHLKNKHSASKLSPQLIFKCSCETIFKKKQLLYQHFHQDASKRVTCVFKCPKCNSVFPHKQQLMEHYKGVHVGNTSLEKNPKEKTDQDQGTNSIQEKNIQEQKRHSRVKHADSPRKKPEQDSRPRAKLSGWTCGDCLQWFPERDAYISHVKTSHGKSVKRYPCRQCDQSFNFAASLRKHVRKDHDGKKKIYSCWYCTDIKTTFTSSVMLKNHISLMHGIKNPDLRQMPKTHVQECKRASGRGRVSERPGIVTKKEVGQDEAGLEAPSAKRPKTQFRCSKCGFLTDNNTKFQQHIPQHKTNESSHQCLHCGLCFTSVLSLNRHLFIVHKVRDPEEEEVKEKKKGKKLVRSAENEEVNDLLLELKQAEPPQAEEPASLHCEKNRL